MSKRNHASSRTTHPHFIIIGAPKSGTTWLVETLRMIKCIYIPKYEIHYFSRFYTTKNARWYERHFHSATPQNLIGENSNTYLTDRHAAGRIWSRLPDAKLVAVLRNPIERAYSGYCMQLGRGKASKDIEKHLDPRVPKISDTLQYGKYYELLRRYFDIFPTEQIFIMLYDDISLQPRKTLVDLATFLKVKQPEHVRPLSTRVNARKRMSIAYPVRRILWPLVSREAVRRPLVKLMRAIPLWKGTERVLSRQIIYPPLSDDMHRRLTEYYADDVHQLSGILRRDLSGWLVGRR